MLKGNPVQPLLPVIDSLRLAKTLTTSSPTIKARALTAILEGEDFVISRGVILGFAVFVFKPNEAQPVYIQRNLCKQKIQLAAFIPRDEPEMISSEKYLWLRRSQLFFLTETQVRNTD